MQWLWFCPEGTIIFCIKVASSGTNYILMQLIFTIFSENSIRSHLSALTQLLAPYSKIN